MSRLLRERKGETVEAEELLRAFLEALRAQRAGGERVPDGLAEQASTLLARWAEAWAWRRGVPRAIARDFGEWIGSWPYFNEGFAELDRYVRDRGAICPYVRHYWLLNAYKRFRREFGSAPPLGQWVLDPPDPARDPVQALADRELLLACYACAKKIASEPSQRLSYCLFLLADFDGHQFGFHRLRDIGFEEGIVSEFTGRNFEDLARELTDRMTRAREARVEGKTLPEEAGKQGDFSHEFVNSLLLPEFKKSQEAIRTKIMRFRIRLERLLSARVSP